MTKRVILQDAKTKEELHPRTEVASVVGLQTALDGLDERIDAIVGGNATLNLSASPASIFANTSTQITVTATASMQASSIAIKKGGSIMQSGTDTTSISYTDTLNMAGGASVTYTAEGVISGVNKTASSKTVRAYDKIYSGVGTESSYAGLAANASVKTSASGTYNFSFSAQSASKYIYILVPNSMSAIDLSNVKLDSGFGYNLSLVASNVNYKGDGVLYRVYRSVEENNANVKLIIG